VNINSLIQEASAGTPDPERSLKNLERLINESPETLQEHADQIEVIAGLFAYSQFLADYCIRNPSSLSRALKDHSILIDKKDILAGAYHAYGSFRDEERSLIYKQKALQLLRDIKKEYLLSITLKDISNFTSLNECMSELSILSEALLELALDMSSTIMRRKFGFLRENAFSIIGMGKLGAGELNYSSDIDIITVYRSEGSISTGILNPFGIRYNKISSHEYFCALTEILANLLQSPTEDGIAYRVDLRLRPNSRKGATSLSLDSYRSYYEAWGKTWERMSLIRAKPIAGDHVLGERFIHIIEPFVWKRSMDYNDIEEVKELKKRIDSISDVNDIKRGYGGIREIEFFVHTFQLLYGGERKNLRKGSLTSVLEELLQEGFLPGDDVRTLSESYIFLRRIEHILQMKEDMQIYALPARPEELEILSRKMHFQDKTAFSAELKLKRLKVRDMYNSLLGCTDASQEVMLTLSEELPLDAILDYLSFKGFRNPDAALKNIEALHDYISTGKTMRERNLLRKTVPAFFEQVVKSVNKDRSLGTLVSFIRKIGNHESYTDLLLRRNDTREILVDTFSASTYLTRSLLSLENLEGIFEYPDIRMDFRSLQGRLKIASGQAGDASNIIREFKVTEELKAGMLFLKGFLDAYGFSRALNMLASAVIRAVVRFLHIKKNFAVIGLGGFGAGELNIGSDLDLMFVGTQKKLSVTRKKYHAEELIRLLSEYTSQGFAYKVDMRLRP
jgi:glutamate-ammonia-ligase adenylyltransferase